MDVSIKNLDKEVTNAYVPALYTHRWSLLPIEWFSEIFRLAPLFTHAKVSRIMVLTSLYRLMQMQRTHGVRAL